MTTLAHISDLHFGTTLPELLEALRADLNRQKPDILVISGDFTQRAKKEEFLQAKAFIESLPQPQLLVPGNHDLPHWNLLERFVKPLKRYRRYLTDELFPFVEAENCAVLGLNTARAGGFYADWSKGRISDRQIGIVERSFADVPAGKMKIVVTHHPFLVPDIAKDRGVIGNAHDALHAFAEIGVDLLLSGHLHLGFTGHALTQHQIVERILVIQAATATSTRLKSEPNAYNWITIDGNEIRLRKRVWRGQQYCEDEEDRFKVAHMLDPRRRDKVEAR
ncbi:MAG: 3' 5'-cyclic-nucleotide phosphodiesterase [Puniceicoccaceae bacterium 5H]|nr:MAG: 3' 5'-cyclic-nucleotide phosphodiesterase [Puniceicoccaceae bacterium 5H]